VAWVKALHITGLLVWCAGLLYFPGLLASHARLAEGEDFVRIRRASRFAHNAVVSPAAVIAIGAGTALLFLSPGVLQGWMFLKLACVGVLAMAHVYYGHVLGSLAARGVPPPRRLLWAAWCAVLASILAILGLVLAKPVVEATLPAWMLEPGGLQSWLDSRMPT
jgi:uncharacterized membrane protein